MKIHCIQTGEVQIKSRHVLPRYNSQIARVVDVIRDPEWSPRLPISCWLIEHPEGLIMVDTGESARVMKPGYLPAWHPLVRTSERFWVHTQEEVGARLRALGFDPGDVRWVIMTHMHGDHAGGLAHFPRSEILVSAAEARAALSFAGPAFGYVNRHYPAWFKPSIVDFGSGGWEGFETSLALTADKRVRIVPTPGHTLGHMSVVVEQNCYLILIAGDAAYSEAALVDGRLDGVAQNARLHRESTGLLRALCRRHRVVTQFAHDPNSGARLRAKRLTVVRDYAK